MFLGVAIDDGRESPALVIIDIVIQKGGIVSSNDPHISAVKTNNDNHLHSIELTTKSVQDSDCVVLTTNHNAFDIGFIQENAMLNVDMRNIVKEDFKNVYKLYKQIIFLKFNSLKIWI